jgi:hypothetical protein
MPSNGFSILRVAEFASDKSPVLKWIKNVFKHVTRGGYGSRFSDYEPSNGNMSN